MPSPLAASVYRCVTLLAALAAALATAAAAHAAPTTNTLTSQNVTTTSATLEGQGTCIANTTCKAFFHWHQTGGGAWYNAALVSHPCSGSSPCAWSQSAPLSGLIEGTTYAYFLCSADGTTTFSYTCYGPNGSTTTAQVFTTVWLPPASVSPPTIAGTPREFDMLTEQKGSWTNSPTGYSYQWKDCSPSGTGCVNIPGATRVSYILGAGDVGHTIEVQETATNSGGSGTPVISAPTATISPSAIMATTGVLTFSGNFETGTPNPPWSGALCANYGTPASNGVLRGSFYFDQAPAPVGQGLLSGRFDLPAATNPTSYPRVACGLPTKYLPMTLPADEYYGLEVYVPTGFHESFAAPSNGFWGVAILELHKLINNGGWGSPVQLQLHDDHITLALQTGSCIPYGHPNAGCQYHTNADNPGGSPGNLPALYAIPPAALVQGAWNEIVIHVHWAADSTGEIQTWYRPAGTNAWTQSASINGYPTMQWDSTTGCCVASYVNQTEAYSSALASPLSVWLDDSLTGTGFGSITATMP